MKVYLDNSATTAVTPEVLEAMLPYFSDGFGNAQSVHSYGQRARAAVETARRQVSALIGASPAEIIFTSGGTESDNLAIRGVAEAHRSRGRHIVTTNIEHPAVTATCQSLERAGGEVSYVPVNSAGLVDAGDVIRAIRADTTLVTVMQSNNEIGTLQPIQEIGAAIKELRGAGRPAPLFHTDAVQSTGKVPIDVDTLGVDLLSLSGHKIHGPKGSGALYLRKATRIEKLLHGGHHERDRRAGTENVPAIVGLGKAAEQARLELGRRADSMQRLRDNLQSEILARIPGARVNGDTRRRLPNILNVSFEGLDGESLLIALDMKGVAVSTGAACASGSLEPSPVLRALGLTREAVRGSIRLSLSRLTTAEEVSYAVRVLVETVARLRAMAPDGETEKAVQETL
ncbi:MAG TPA: IscS subfamily cysteine desulfurase [Blastocatellia bacterium]|nr:IscS subfamily cysteine desulfurase [Blastocatellia bacterium]